MLWMPVPTRASKNGAAAPAGVTQQFREAGGSDAASLRAQQFQSNDVKRPVAPEKRFSAPSAPNATILSIRLVPSKQRFRALAAAAQRF